MPTRGVFDDDHFSPAMLIPFSVFNSTSAASGTISANLVTGACNVVLVCSGATGLTMPTANQMFLAFQGICPNMNGFQYRLRIINTNGGTLTLTAGTGGSIPGTKTLSTNTWREYDVTFLDNHTCTFQSVGTGTYS